MLDALCWKEACYIDLLKPVPLSLRLLKIFAGLLFPIFVFSNQIKVHYIYADIFKK